MSSTASMQAHALAAASAALGAEAGRLKIAQSGEGADGATWLSDHGVLELALDGEGDGGASSTVYALCLRRRQLKSLSRLALFREQPTAEDTASLEPVGAAAIAASVVYCDLNNNRIRSLPRSLARCTALRHLDLSLNHIVLGATGHDGAEGSGVAALGARRRDCGLHVALALPALQHLDLSTNRIERFGGAMLDGVALPRGEPEPTAAPGSWASPSLATLNLAANHAGSSSFWSANGF